MSWLYFIREGETGPIKIGRSNDPWKRLDTLQSGNPRQLVLIAAQRVGKTAHIAERNAHREFVAHRMIGEWYAPVAGIVDMATQIGMPACENCAADEDRLHVWASARYSSVTRALCFRCFNAAEIEKIRDEEKKGLRLPS